MKHIKITLLKNKRFTAINKDDISVQEDENNATIVDVEFPSEYEYFSKRVDFLNIRNETWSIGLYQPEDQRKSYDDNFDKLHFSFTVPRAMAKRGELKMQFVAYLADESQTIVPFHIVLITINESIQYGENEANDEPNLLLQAYEYGNYAINKANEAISISQTAEEISREAREIASGTISKATTAVNTSNSANTKSDNAVAVANEARNISNDALNRVVENNGTRVYIGSKTTPEPNLNFTSCPQEQINTNKTNINTNKTNISTNTTNIATNKSNISSNVSEITKIKDNTTTPANSNGGFGCGTGATKGSDLNFRGYTLCDSAGKIPVARMLESIYPIGTVYISVNSTSPAQLFGGGWQMLPAGYALWTSSSGGGETIDAGLPNITGSKFLAWNDASGGGVLMNAENSNSYGALFSSRRTGKAFYTAGSSHSAHSDLEFDASRSNAIYGNSETVQPPAYKIYAWKRIS